MRMVPRLQCQESWDLSGLGFPDSVGRPQRVDVVQGVAAAAASSPAWFATLPALWCDSQTIFEADPYNPSCVCVCVCLCRLYVLYTYR